MKWHFLIPLTLIYGLAVFTASPDDYFALPPWLLTIALIISLHAQPEEVLPGVWWCGIVQDAFVQGQLGIATVFFCLSGLTVLLLRQQIRGDFIAFIGLTWGVGAMTIAAINWLGCGYLTNENIWQILLLPYVIIAAEFVLTRYCPLWRLPPPLEQVKLQRKKRQI